MHGQYIILQKLPAHNVSAHYFAGALFGYPAIHHPGSPSMHTSTSGSAWHIPRQPQVRRLTDWPCFAISSPSARYVLLGSGGDAAGAHADTYEVFIAALHSDSLIVSKSSGRNCRHTAYASLEYREMMSDHIGLFQVAVNCAVYRHDRRQAAAAQAPHTFNIKKPV